MAVRGGPKSQEREEEGADGKSEVAAFLRALGLSQYTEQLFSNGFDDMDTLMHMEDADMRDLGWPAFHVVKLRRKLQELQRQAPGLHENNPVVAFLQDIGLIQYAEVLLQNGFDDMDVLMDIEDGDLKDLGFPRGHAVKLKRRLQECRAPEESGRRFLQQPTAAQPAPVFKSTTARRAENVQAHSLPSHDAHDVPSCEAQTAVERSWQQVQAAGGYYVAELLYRHTFQLEPEVIDLFPPEVRYKYRDWTADEGVDERNIYESPALRKLFSKYMNAIGCTVAGLNDFSKLVPMLRALGARHIGYGVSERHWPILGKALMLTLQDVLGDAFTSEVESAWMMVYGFMSSIMIEGLRHAIASRSQLSGGPLPLSDKMGASGPGSEHLPEDDDACSQGSRTTGGASNSVVSMDTWGRQASALSEDTAADRHLQQREEGPGLSHPFLVKQ